MKRKLLIFIPSLSGGGAERTIVNLIRYIDNTDFEVVLVLLKHIANEIQKNEYLYLIKDQVKIRYLDCSISKFSVLKIIKQLALCIKKENPDLIFSTINKVNIITIISNMVSGMSKPIIIRESNNRSEEGMSFLTKNLTRLTYNAADKVIALSEGVREDLNKNFRIKADKLKVIYNPVDIQYINQAKNETVEDIRKENNEKLIIAVGRLVEQKDFPTLLKALRLILNEVSARLIILGKGPQKKYLEDLCKELGIEEKVLFLGFRKNPYKYMHNADLFILSSKWEGFGHVLVEAMATKNAVISTNCNSGPAEILADGEFGKLVSVENHEELADEAIALLTDEENRELISIKGVKRAQQFDAKEIVKEYENLFLEVIKSKD